MIYSLIQAARVLVQVLLLQSSAKLLSVLVDVLGLPSEQKRSPPVAELHREIYGLSLKFAYFYIYFLRCGSSHSESATCILIILKFIPIVRVPRCVALQQQQNSSGLYSVVRHSDRLHEGSCEAHTRTE